jgi:hypothetical protein
MLPLLSAFMVAAPMGVLICSVTALQLSVKVAGGNNRPVERQACGEVLVRLAFTLKAGLEMLGAILSSTLMNCTLS